jgi:hypothetical protein
MAQRLRDGGAPLGEVFTLLSGLYFRGKLAYAKAFGRAVSITPNSGLMPAETLITSLELCAFGCVDIHQDDPRYRRPLERDARLSEEDAEVVLLGSIATGKYVDVLGKILGDRLVFPAEFVGRGDMSRGGLMLRCVQQRRELTYTPVTGATRHGCRSPRLPKLR